MRAIINIRLSNNQTQTEAKLPTVKVPEEFVPPPEPPFLVMNQSFSLTRAVNYYSAC